MKVIAVLVVLVLGFPVAVYVASEMHLRSFARPPTFTLDIADDAASIERGAHLARTRGCFGCHGKDLAGEHLWDFAVASNLPALARSESASTLDATKSLSMASI